MSLYELPKRYDVTYESPGVIPAPYTTKVPHIPLTLKEACPVPKLKEPESLNKIYNKAVEITAEAEDLYKDLIRWNKEIGHQSLAMNKVGLLINKLNVLRIALEDHATVSSKKLLGTKIDTYA